MFCCFASVFQISLTFPFCCWMCEGQTHLVVVCGHIPAGGSYAFLITLLPHVDYSATWIAQLVVIFSSLPTQLSYDTHWEVHKLLVVVLKYTEVVVC